MLTYFLIISFIIFILLIFYIISMFSGGSGLLGPGVGIAIAGLLVYFFIKSKNEIRRKRPDSTTARARRRRASVVHLAGVPTPV